MYTLPEPTRKLFEDALEHYGVEHQLGMVQEECGELITVLNKLKRNKKKIDDVAEEIADVYIMCLQAANIFDEDLVKEKIHQKLTRLENYINEEKTFGTETLSTCPVCNLPQRKTPSGLVCKNGHGF